MKESGWYCQGSAGYANALQGGSLKLLLLREWNTEWRNGACWQPEVSYLFTFYLQASGMPATIGRVLVLAWQADWAWRSAFPASHSLPELAFPGSLSSLWVRVRKEEQTPLSPQYQGDAGHALVKRPGDRWNGCVPLALTYTMPST